MWLLCITYYKNVMSCRSYVYWVIKLIIKVLSLYIYVCWVYLVIKSYKLLISCCIYKVMFVRLLKLLKIRCLFTLPIKKTCVYPVIKIVRCLFRFYVCSSVHRNSRLKKSGPKPVLIRSRLRKLVSLIVWSVPEAATTVLCTPDDGRDGRPKHVD